ncbi:aldehyde ferredoxin oxidoreductase C-terminal domain-containing protein [Pseudobacteroides cellulosolvens]|uniref:Aldehyde ferredoxin oxidoreductase n=1 Tax=Pseudobacteroides cellulosolvens ATCC 35603 = DSM 2933 TaxID=398512 RepID=A0A0L6JRE4_9FIRM|nr:aldehyde ferredoxin oxidoreductase C-terminal domain-containing protein [Pseudobacteroides cellulosolvens]KNY28416.1 Aldehyde ferredoxin oxidoreductase [Pseudobacteroides cellulosolvens ATCC 35603 = DSM 2933]
MIYEKYIKVLYIDLTQKKIRIDHRKDLCDYLGGVGVATKLLEENLKPELDVLDEQQPIILAIGAASTVFPVITKTVAMFRSPLTGELGESYAGGRLAMTLFMAGYDAIVITGKSKSTSYLTISRNNVEFKDARAFAGMSNDKIGRNIREREPGGGKRSIIRIGPAGENLVKYASVCVDTYRHFGRLGLGAVFGSKNLKAITVLGDKNLPIKNFKEYFKVFQEIYQRVTDTEIMSKYHDVGTPINIEPLNAAGALPTKNLKQGVFECGDKISGDTFAKNNLVRKMACTGCPVGCIHIGQYRREFDKGYEYEAVSVGYDYELIFALGSFLGIKSSDEVLQLIEEVEKAGMDAMSAGVVLGWATEALAKKLVNEEQTLVNLAFGNTENYLKAIQYISIRKNEFYSYLGEGVDKASDVYGGKDFAMALGKNEMPGYHTGYGAIVGATVGARHSHLCNGGYSLDQSMKEFDKEKMVNALFEEEKERCMLNSLIICLFARKVYDRKTIISVLNSIGYDLTNDDLTAIGERIYKSKLRIKKSLGFDLKEVKLPKRFFETPSMSGILDEKLTYEMIEMYNNKTEELLAKES